MTEISPNILYSIDELRQLIGIQNINRLLKKFNVEPVSKGKYLGASILVALCPDFYKNAYLQKGFDNDPPEILIRKLKSVASIHDKTINPHRI